MKLSNLLNELPKPLKETINYFQSLCSLCIMLAPMAPHIGNIK